LYDKDTVLMVECIMHNFGHKVAKRKRWSVLSLRCD
jgi:hypothetical protein